MGKYNRDCQLIKNCGENITVNHTPNSQALCLPQGELPLLSYFTGIFSLTHPGKENKEDFSFTLLLFALMRLQVWVNYFVQGHTTTEGSQAIHFIYYYAVLYFILPRRASEKRILKGYSN